VSRVWAIFKREVRSYFASPLAYAAIAVFLIILGVLFAWALGSYATARLQAAQNPLMQVPGVETMVRNLLGSDIIWALFLIVPLLTMRLLAEERRQHTAELLLTAPMTTRALVAGKFLGATFVLVVMLALSAWMPFLLHLWGGCDPAVIWTGYAGALLYGSLLLAIGLLASSLTESVMLAAFLSLLFVAIVNVAAPLAGQVPVIGPTLEQFTPVQNLNKIARGVIDSQAVVYFVTVTLFFLDLTARVVDSQRWR
jgi:ABC-2 type transport system permease protein